MQPGALLRLRGLKCGSVRMSPVTARPAVEGARRERGGDRRAKRPPGQPRASSLAAFEPSLHFVDVVHALDDGAAGVGG